MLSQVVVELYKRFSLAETKISLKGSIHIPKKVIVNYRIKDGDILEWYPPTVDIPDKEVEDCMIVKIRRQERRSQIQGGLE